MCLSTMLLRFMLSTSIFWFAEYYVVSWGVACSLKCYYSCKIEMAWKWRDLLITYGEQRREGTQNLCDKKKESKVSKMQVGFFVVVA